MKASELPEKWYERALLRVVEFFTGRRRGVVLYINLSWGGAGNQWFHVHRVSTGEDERHATWLDWSEFPSPGTIITYKVHKRTGGLGYGLSELTIVDEK